MQDMTRMLRGREAVASAKAVGMVACFQKMIVAFIFRVSLLSLSR